MADVIQIKIDLGGTDKAVERIRQANGLRLGLAAAAVHLKGKVAVYPQKKVITRKSVYGTTWKTDKQRKFMMWAIRSGYIKLPYQRGADRRSEAFGRRWTTEARNGGLVQVVGNNASYGEWVQGDNQSQFMKAQGWTKASEIAEKEFGTIRRIIDTYVRKDLG